MRFNMYSSLHSLHPSFHISFNSFVVFHLVVTLFNISVQLSFIIYIHLTRSGTFWSWEINCEYFKVLPDIQWIVTTHITGCTARRRIKYSVLKQSLMISITTIIIIIIIIIILIIMVAFKTSYGRTHQLWAFAILFNLSTWLHLFNSNCSIVIHDINNGHVVHKYNVDGHPYLQN